MSERQYVLDKSEQPQSFTENVTNFSKVASAHTYQLLLQVLGQMYHLWTAAEG